MNRLLFILAIAALGLVGGLSTVPQQASAGSLAQWPPLSATCNDVSGDGAVDLPNDILAVIQHFDARWGSDNYALVFDVSGGGVIDLPNDILGTILAFDPQGTSGNCSLVDTQVIRSAVALLPYQDCQAAANDGYESTGVYVPGMGIHISKLANLKTTFDPENWDDLANPFGLVCSVDPATGGVGKLIGPWYIVPTTSTGTLYGKSPPFQPDDTPPAGFATNEDYITYDQSNPGVQAGWHTHINLCVGVGFLSEQGPSGTHNTCKTAGGFLNVPLYGWMLHLYNFVPNPAGRFMRWNYNPAFPICEYDPAPCGGGASGFGDGNAQPAVPLDAAFCVINLAVLDEPIDGVTARTIAP